MSAVAVTGGRGLLGSTLLRVLPGAVPLTSDIRDGAALQEEIERSGAAWIVHTAAKVNVGECEKNPEEAHAVHVLGTGHVVATARKIGARVISISTVSVFDGHAGNYRETDTPNPVNVYNTTKREGELVALAYDKGIVLRLNLLGVPPGGSRGRSFLEWLVDSIRANKDLNLFNDQYINALSNWTVASLIKTIIKKEITEQILHIGSSDVLSKAAIGKMVLTRFPAYTGTIDEKSVETVADGVVRPKQMWLNCEHTGNLLGITFPTTASEIETIFSSAPFL